MRRAGFPGKDHHAEKGGREQEKRKPQYEIVLLPKGNHRLEFARLEQGSGGRDILERARS